MIACVLATVVEYHSKNQIVFLNHCAQQLVCIFKNLVS